MVMLRAVILSAIIVAAPASAQAPTALPADTVIQIVPVEDITSMHMKEGDKERLQVASDVAENGLVVIPRGSTVVGTITWRTGKGIGGKSAKFDLTFNSVTVNGHQYALKGKHRQEGKGNTLVALFGTMVATGHSAVMESGQVVTAFTAEPIPLGVAYQTGAPTSGQSAYDVGRAAGQAAAGSSPH